MRYNNTNWTDNYLSYLDFRSKGSRQKALEVLELFISVFKTQNSHVRREFIDQINLKAFQEKDFQKYIPHNLYRVFLQEIEQWKIEEPRNPIALRWSRDISDLELAVSLDPSNQVTLQLLFKGVINKVSMNQHELNGGFGYLGDPAEDARLIKFLKIQLDCIEDKELKLRIKPIVDDLETKAKDNIK